MKNEKKQTAVDWLFLNLKSHFEHDGDLLEVVQMSYEQAKEMEYQQMIEFGAKCIESQNETYGGENAE